MVFRQDCRTEKMFKSLLNILGVTAFVITAGCATPMYNYMPTTTAVSIPRLNTVFTAQVGDELLRQGKQREHDAIYLMSSVSMGGFSAYTLHPGYYLKRGEDVSAEYYLPGGEQEAGIVEKKALADPWKSIMTKKEDTTALCVVTAFNFYVCNTAVFERRSIHVSSQDSFTQTLIYSGKVGNKINIGYREFSANIARPAFNNSVEYDLSESNIIGYKGAQLEIIDATNQGITYKVLRNFNNATY
jgi:hypothetical protein